MSDSIIINIGKGGQRDMAEAFAHKNNIPILEVSGSKLVDRKNNCDKLADMENNSCKQAAKEKNCSLAPAKGKAGRARAAAETAEAGLTVLFDAKGVSLTGYGLTYQGDFEGMLHRVTKGRLAHELLARAAKLPGLEAGSGQKKKAIDATAGMGEDALLLAACGYEVTLCEQNPVIALLLKDALQRAKNHPDLKDIVARMSLYQGDSIELLQSLTAAGDTVDLVYLDPMFPKRQKSGLINKKLQLIQKLEPPCSLEEELFAAATASGPQKIIVKRPLHSPCLAGRKPSYTLNGKAIRYDCYVLI